MKRASFKSVSIRFLYAAGFLFPALSAIAAPPPPPPFILQPPPPSPTPPGNPQAATPLTRLAAIGQLLLFDRNLSEPAGTACVNCHSGASGFSSNNGSRIGVPAGSRPNVLGLRNSMTNAYGTLVPPFSFRVKNGDTDAVGGHFWDGRAATLAAQALIPFLSPTEMNNPSAASVVRKVAASGYANLFRAEFGQAIFDNPELAFQKIGVAIAAYESSSDLQQFSSKYDMYVRGQVALTPSEANGMKLFMDPKRGNCASCHVMNPASAKPEDSPFADFAYYALGIPRNKDIPQNANPGFFDLGLCGPNRSRPALGANVPGNVSIEQFCGTFRMVTLRNVAKRQAYMHNGFFKDLREVVAFYSTRNSDPQRWYGPAGVPNDLPVAYVPNIIKDRPPFNRAKSAGPLFTPREVDDVVSFLQILNDGFSVAPPGAARP